MRPKSSSAKKAAEQVAKDIRRATRRPRSGSESPSERYGNPLIGPGL